MRYTYEYNGDTVHITLERLADGRIQATIGDTLYTFQAYPTPDGGWAITAPDGNHLVYSDGAQDERYVQVDGTHFQLERQRGRRKRSGKGAQAGDMTAQMPGQIMQIMVQAGDSVSSGQALLVMEAMKMEIRISANQDGIIKRLLVEEGQVVARGQILIEITPAE